MAAESALNWPCSAENCESPLNVASDLPQKSARVLSVCQLFIYFFEMNECPGKEDRSSAG